MVRIVVFLAPFPLPSRLRSGVLQAFGASIGKCAVIRHGVNVAFPWRFSAGDHVWLGEGVRILNLANVSLGDNVCLSQEAFLCTGSHDHRREDFALVCKPITVGSQVWVAARAFVGPGVVLGDGCVVGACAVVMRDVSAGAVVYGNPARPRERAREEA
jgi:putative colanic acid biosynthesis acetyltransferase WcaF